MSTPRKEGFIVKKDLKDTTIHDSVNPELVDSVVPNTISNQEEGLTVANNQKNQIESPIKSNRSRTKDLVSESKLLSPKQMINIGDEDKGVNPNKETVDEEK